MINFHLKPVPHDEAAKLIADKAPVTRDIFDRMPDEIRARAFVVTGIESHDVLQSLRDRIAELPAGADWDSVKEDVVAGLSPHMTLEDANRRASILMRHHGFSAYAAAQARVQDELIEVFPYRQYISTDDFAVRPSHAALNGIVLPADHPFWEKHTPPWEWNCRCDVVELTEIDAEEEKARDKRRNPENRRVLEGSALIQLENGQLNRGPTMNVDVRTPKERGGNYENNVRNLNLPYEEIQKRWDAQTREEFEAWAGTVEIGEAGTIMDWLRGRKPAPTQPAPMPSVNFSAPDLDAIKNRLKPIRAKLDAINFAAPGLTFDDRFRMREEFEKLVEDARRVVEIPSGERGKVKLIAKYTDSWTGKTKTTSPGIVKRAREGAKICERYTEPSLLPEITIKGKAGRAYYAPTERAMYVSSKTSASVMAHEITHGTEIQNTEVLKKAVAFLKKRSNGEKPKKLKDLTGLNYDKDEITYEDLWHARGGSHYCGKDYKETATEVLTMGIERLHKNPASFAQEDQEYFDFVVETLQTKV